MNEVMDEKKAKVSTLVGIVLRNTKPIDRAISLIELLSIARENPRLDALIGFWVGQTCQEVIKEG
jgi:hypothetical protein